MQVMKGEEIVFGYGVLTNQEAEKNFGQKNFAKYFELYCIIHHQRQECEEREIPLFLS